MEEFENLVLQEQNEVETLNSPACVVGPFFFVSD